MEELSHCAQKAIKNRVFPGCVIGVMRGGACEVHAYGSLAYDENLVTPETIYDCASITKSVVTAEIAHQCVEEGVITLDDKVAYRLPEFRNAQHTSTTVRHLLSYAVGGYALAPLASLSPHEIIEYVYTKDFDAAPGEKTRYANMPMFLLGLMLERVMGKSFNELAQERVFARYAMKASSMMSTATPVVAPTEEGVRGIVHDESARSFALAGKAVGHAGLFSSADDMLLFCEAMLSVPRKKEVFEHGLGWEKSAEWMGRGHSSFTIGKTGFTGTSLCIDREAQVAVVILSNRTYPHRPGTQKEITQFRSEIHSGVFGGGW